MSSLLKAFNNHLLEFGCLGKLLEILKDVFLQGFFNRDFIEFAHFDDPGMLK